MPTLANLFTQRLVLFLVMASVFSFARLGQAPWLATAQICEQSLDIRDVVIAKHTKILSATP